MLETLLGGVKPKTNLIKLTDVIPVTSSYVSTSSPYSVSSALVDNVFYLTPFNRNAIANPVYALDTTNMMLNVKATGLSSWNNVTIYPQLGGLGIRGTSNGSVSYRLISVDGGLVVNGNSTEMICLGAYPTQGEPITIKNGNAFWAIGVYLSSSSGSQGYVYRYTYSGTKFDTSRTTIVSSDMWGGGAPVGFISWVYQDAYVYTLFTDGKLTRYTVATGTWNLVSTGPVNFTSAWMATLGKRGAIIGTKLYYFNNTDNTLYYFNITGNTWGVEAVLSELNSYKYAAHVMNGPDGKLIIHPGYNSANTFSKDLFIYTPTA